MATPIQETQSESTNAELDCINEAAGTNDPLERWELIGRASRRLERDPGLLIVEKLIDFAAQPGTLLARLRALDGAFSPSAQWYREVPEDFEPLKRELRQIIPEYFDFGKHFSAKGPSREDGLTYNDGYHFAYHYLIKEFAKKEGVPEHAVFESMVEDHARDDLPIAGLMLLDRITGLPTAASKYLPTSVVADALEVALDFRGEEYQKALLGEPTENTALKFVKLAKIVYSAEFPPIRSITEPLPMETALQDIYGLPEEEKGIYADLLLDLHESAAGLADVFPEELKEALLAGAHKLIADSVFATAEINGENKLRAIQLLSGYELPAHFKPGDDVEMLAAMHKAFKLIHETMGNPQMRAIRATNEDGFNIYRFINPKTGENSEVTLHIRPSGAVGYKDDLEFGRSGEGVEASIGFTVSLDNSWDLMALGKELRRGKFLSVRLDREGLLQEEDISRRDPTRENGKVALDIGSVLGNEDSLNTRIGRFLALGNSSALKQKYRKSITLNHVHEVFNPVFGHKDIFADIARHFESEIKDKRPTKAELDGYIQKLKQRRISERLPVMSSRE